MVNCTIVPKAVENKILQAFQEMKLDYEKEKDEVRFLDLGRGITFVVHKDRFVCSYNQSPEFGHRFSWRKKWLHIDDYVGKGNY